MAVPTRRDLLERIQELEEQNEDLQEHSLTTLRTSSVRTKKEGDDQGEE